MNHVVCLHHFVRRGQILVQQDGAKPHISKRVVDSIKSACHANGNNIDVLTQPPQSPDLIVLDLAFNIGTYAFNHSIQSIA